MDIIDSQGYLKGFAAYTNEDNSQHDSVTMIACGDTGPVRNLERVVLDKGPMHVLGETTSILNSADIVFANLEVVFSERGSPLNRTPVFRLDPKAFEIIKDAKISVVSLANNHMFDYGPEAFIDTFELIKAHNVKAFGAGLILGQALKPAIISSKGLKFGFLGFRDKEHKGFDHNGVITPEINKHIVFEEIKSLRPKVDVLILSLHFGWEYQYYPSPKDVELCRSFIDAGADIILGHHPHYPQGIEEYRNGLIAYSLGNFIWDQKFIGHTDSSYMLSIDVTKKGIHRVKVIPFQMDSKYQLVIKSDKESIEEIELFSKVLSDYNLLREKWYYICRDRFLVLVKDVYKNAFKKRSISYVKTSWLNNVSNPRALYAWFSLFASVFTLKAIKYEVKKILRKRDNKKYSSS